MSFLVPITLFGWIPFVLFLFVVLPPRRAVIMAFLLAWLFLPMAGYGVPGLPDYTKMSATVLGVLMGAALFDADRLLSFRPRLVDIPLAVYCLSPAVSSYLNGLGLYDGCSEIVRQFVTWGLPYVIGRVYFNDLEGLRELAVGIFIGGVMYVPFCWFEVRFSPQLHKWIYGFRQHSFAQNVRDGGFRPMVFMQHGLMVAMWMAMTTLVGTWLWRCKTIRKVWGMPLYAVIPAMLFTVYLCKSKYALLLIIAGLGALFLSKWMRMRAVVICLILVPPTYMMLRSTAIMTGETLVTSAEDMFGEDRAKSLALRVNNENLLSERAMEHAWFGWGGWGGSKVVNENGKMLVTDSLWLITLGLGALTMMLLMPMILVCWDYRVEWWSHPAIAPAVVLAMMCAMYMFDHLMNGMVNPIFMLAVGAVSAGHYAVPQAVKAPARAPARTMTSPRRVPPPAFRPA
jgi:hypothetical protein